MRQRIIDKLSAALAPTFLEVIDESHKHEGHAGNNMSGESHFQVVIAAVVLNGLTRVAAHQMVYKVLSDEMRHIHALGIRVES